MIDLPCENGSVWSQFSTSEMGYWYEMIDHMIWEQQKIEWFLDRYMLVAYYICCATTVWVSEDGIVITSLGN